MVDGTETLSGSLEDLRAFCAVVEFGTISAAARVLRETKGSVSRRVSRLEGRLGVSLLARTPRAVTVTEEGATFHARTREALRILDDAVELTVASRSVPQGHLRVTAPIDLGMEVLPEILVRFRAQHPHMTVELVLSDEPLDLAANRIDLALRASAKGLPDMGYRASILAPLRVALFASPAYLAARGTPTTPGALAGHDLIMPRVLDDARPLKLGDGRGRSELVAAHVTIRSTDYASVHRLALAGGGVAPVPELVAARSCSAGLLVPLLPKWFIAEAHLHAISLGGRAVPARVSVFREFLRSQLALAIVAGRVEP